MNQMGTADERIFQHVTVADVPLDNPENAAEQVVRLVAGKPPEQAPQPRFGLINGAFHKAGGSGLQLIG
jgi:hypothetical protein